MGGGPGTHGTTTIEYDDPTTSSAIGFYPAAPYLPNGGLAPEDLESQLLHKAARVRSYNRVGPNSRLHKTIDENMILKKVLSARKTHQEEEGDTLDHRMRIFEDEIIKRIKII